MHDYVNKDFDNVTCFRNFLFLLLQFRGIDFVAKCLRTRNKRKAFSFFIYHFLRDQVAELGDHQNS